MWITTHVFSEQETAVLGCTVALHCPRVRRPPAFRQSALPPRKVCMLAYTFSELTGYQESGIQLCGPKWDLGNV